MQLNGIWRDSIKHFAKLPGRWVHENCKCAHAEISANLNQFAGKIIGNASGTRCHQIDAHRIRASTGNGSNILNASHSTDFDAKQYKCRFQFGLTRRSALYS